MKEEKPKKPIISKTKKAKVNGKVAKGGGSCSPSCNTGNYLQLDTVPVTQVQGGGGPIKAMVISCMDYRFVNDKVEYLDELGYNKEYDHYVMAGASIGFSKAKWKRVAFEHIDLAIKLHKINEIIILDHMDCGAYKLLMPDAPDEKKAHIRVLKKVRKQLLKLYPKMTVTLKLMNVDGTVKLIK